MNISEVNEEKREQIYEEGFSVVNSFQCDDCGCPNFKIVDIQLDESKEEFTKVAVCANCGAILF